MSARLLVATLVLSALFLPEAARAQGRDCNLIESQTVQESIQGGFSIITLTGRFAFRCVDGTELRADFGTLNETTRELFLSGNVFYRDPERQLTSQQARYTSVIGRLHATGDVVFTDRAGGSSLRGPEVEYYRTMPGRPLAQVIATARPHVTLLPQSQRGTDSEPLAVDADRVTIVGDDQFTAVGSVLIRRSDLDGSSHEARFDGVRELLELRGAAEVRGEQFTLSGEMIDAVVPEGGIERVHARQNAALVGEEVRVNAADLQLFFLREPTESIERILAREKAALVAEDLQVDAFELQLFFARDSLERMVARGSDPQATNAPAGGRAVAISGSFRLEADSLDALLPGQRLQQVIAVGNARGETVDTARAGEVLAPELIAGAVSPDRDWLMGDTIIGYFSAVDPPAEGGEGDAEEREVQLERLIARGAARSLYRVPPREEEAGAGQGEGRPALNYLVGNVIELTLSGGELELANVTGLQQGLYLEPAPPPPPAPVEEEAPQPAEPRVSGRAPPRMRP